LYRRGWNFRGLSLVVLLAGLCAAPGAARSEQPITFPDTQYEPVEWSDIDGWADDDHATALPLT
jgi:hypothetical protein